MSVVRSRMMAKQATPSADDIKKFYDTHPELFSERNVYVIQEFAVKDGNEHASEIEAGINAAKTADDLAKWLKDNNYIFSANASRKAAEQLPLELLKKLNTLKAGDTLVVKSPQALVLLFLAKVDRQPVDLEKAKPVIQQFLVNSNQQTVIKNEVAALRKDAKVEFYGDFSKLTLDSSAPTAPAVPAAPVEAKPESAVASPVSETTEPPAHHNQAIEKGLSGL